MTEVLVAAGSNVAPEENLRRALDELARHHPGLRPSRAYRNRAVGFEGEDFVNLVVAFDTEDSLPEVIGNLHQAEAGCGRARNAPKWAPRTMTAQADTRKPLPGPDVAVLELSLQQATDLHEKCPTAPEYAILQANVHQQSACISWLPSNGATLKIT